MAEMIKTPRATFSYPFVFEKQKAMEEGGKEKYSVVLIFDEAAQKTALFKAMKKQAVDVAMEEWGNKAPDMIRNKKIKMPFRDDGEEKGYPEGSVFITIKSDRKPQIVGIISDPNNDNKPMKIEDPEQIYPGAIGMATVRAFTYDVKGNKGVSFALGNLQKTEDGERLDGRTKAEDEFEADMDAVGDLEDLEEEDDAPPKGRKAAAGKKGKAAPPEEEEEEEEDEPPARGKNGKKTAAKPAAGKGGKKPPADDDLDDLYE